MSAPLEMIRFGDTSNIDETFALKELDDSLDIKNSAFTLFFCSKQYSTPTFAKLLADTSHGSAIAGCTTAGEISRKGYQSKSISAISFSKEYFSVATKNIQNLKHFTSEQAILTIEDLKREIEVSQASDIRECFALLLVDGLSITEEPVTFKLQNALGEIPLIGGSAGDELEFKSTEIYQNGNFVSDSATIILVRTPRPWEVFKEHHFTPTDTRAVVTEANTDNRIILELNGYPAASELAKMIGLNSEKELTAEILAQNPLMVRLGNNWFIRSVQTVNSNGSLTLYCSIEEGLVLSLGVNSNILNALKDKFEAIENRLGHTKVTIACDCIMRRLELEFNQQLDDASKILEQYNTMGFSTYGEQFGSVHINQTLTGIAIG